MIQYLPVEESVIDGKGLYFIPCIWLHGHKKGIGDFQGKGLGTALLKAAENDAKKWVRQAWQHGDYGCLFG